MYRLRLGEFEFDPASGELTRVSGGGRRQTERLPPQPAKLLLLLAEKRGQLLTREEIQAELWPDAQVDFDRGLNFCVRQVRAALGDSATEPRCIETLPRRGYRLLLSVEPLERDSPMPEPAAESKAVAGPAAASPPVGPRPARDRRLLASGAVLIMAALAVVAWVARESPAEPGLRIGITPFLPPAGTSVPGDPSRIAESLLDQLTRAGGERASVIGPRTTAVFDVNAPAGGGLQRAAEELRLDYIVNGRFIQTEQGSELLAELIRTSDGRHVWVKRYADLARWQEIANEIATAVDEELALEGL